jgi:hypothetical protein
MGQEAELQKNRNNVSNTEVLAEEVGKYVAVSRSI